MKKYKLIKEYPGCQLLKYKVGDTVIQFEFSGIKWYNKSGDHRELCLLQSSVEDYTEFWEEVKEWEITVFEWGSGSFTRLVKEDTYVSDDASEDFKRSGKGATLSCMLEYMKDLYNGLSINQIKRLSDGELFTVGDKIKNATIRCFKVSDGELKVFVNPNDNPSIFEVGLGLLEKLKPLFTTEDGVDIFYGDECWYVLNRNSFVGGNYIKRKRKCNGRAQEGKYFFYEENADAYLKQGRKILYGVDSEFKRTREEIEERVNKAFSAGNWKWFNSEKEREIYIEENQPRFSMKDVKEFCLASVDRFKYCAPSDTSFKAWFDLQTKKK